jgi:hypothetical protein
MKGNILLTRDSFREGVFERDGHKCVICKEPGQDAHHIIERRLFSDGGYYLDNGATLCGKHHIEAEQTTLSCDEIRDKAGIKHVVLPEHLYDDLQYDKWGNILLPNGNRLRGELFNVESVHKILEAGKVLDSFSEYIKYPRTNHLPWSQMGKDDRQLKDDSNFEGEEVVGTIKMDGENTSVYPDYIHARSIDGTVHESRSWVRGHLFQKVCWQLSKGMRLCGENLYARHSIAYNDLESYFYLFSVWQDMTCFSWDETVDYATLLDLKVVPVFYRGIYDKEKIIKEYNTNFKGPQTEGYVIRLASSFEYKDFRKSVAKFVEPSFRQKVNDAHGHWIREKIVPNKLKHNG